MKGYRNTARGFTLVEILIVVIILGILAAIVIPQFTNASSDARDNSLRSLLQTIRSQVELYKLQHGDKYPTTNGNADGAAWDWTRLTAKTNFAGATTGTGLNFGPYLQDTPRNPKQDVSTATVMGTAASATVGFFLTTDGKIKGTDGAGAAFVD